MSFLEKRKLLSPEMRLKIAIFLILISTSISVFTQSGRKRSEKRVPEPSQTRDTLPSNRDESHTESDEVLRISSNLVSIPVTVLDNRGRPVVGLKLEEFQLKVDGTREKISELIRSESPVRICLLFDNSSSVTPEREFEKLAAKKFFRQVLRPIDHAAILSISSEPTLEHPFTNDVERLVYVIDSFGKPEGATALLDTISHAAELIRPHNTRKVIVIISDGADTLSATSFDTVMREVQVANSQVYAVQTGYRQHANLRDLVAERRFVELSTQTGGYYFTPHSRAELDEAFARISAELSQQYILSYYANEEKSDGKPHSISVAVTGRDAVNVRFRRGFISTSEKNRPKS
jgi:Ca-activated chloride channel homolog